MGLKEYRRKRNTKQSGEPHGKGRSQGKKPVFVIHKHDASHLHYDFRLQIDGVLKSWAVPKGPSTDPAEKRLAIETEDHPLDYAGFEGVIPQGHYGAGTVMVWDSGTFKNLAEDSSLATSWQQGLIEVWLEGEKLRGGYALKQFREEDGKRQWLLIKMDDDEANARRNPVSTEAASVLSGRDLKTITRDES